LDVCADSLYLVVSMYSQAGPILASLWAGYKIKVIPGNFCNTANHSFYIVFGVTIHIVNSLERKLILQPAHSDIKTGLTCAHRNRPSIEYTELV